MRQRTLVFAVLVATLVAACVGCAGAPRAYVAEPEYDFGVVEDGAQVQHVFLIDNQGDSDLSILDVHASCGCTTTNISGTTVPPGDTIRLTATLTTEGYGGSRVSKTIFVKTDDPEHPVLTLRLGGTVVAATAYLVPAQDAAASLGLVIDLRALADYVAGHLIGAVSLAPADVSTWMTYLPQTAPILLYDKDGTTALPVVDALQRAGFLNVRVLLGGFDEWTRIYGQRLVVTFATVLIPL